MDEPVNISVVPVSPYGTIRVSLPITYSWEYSGDYPQAEAEVQLRIGGVYTTIGTVTGQETSIASEVKPAPGNNIWQVKVTDTRGNESGWEPAEFSATYASTSFLNPYNSRTSGRIDRFVSNRFEVRMDHSGTPYQDYRVENPVFYWKLSDASEWNSVEMSTDGGIRGYVNIPANTFPKGNLQWYASAGDGQGHTRTTDTYTLLTEAAPIQATPIAPIDTVEPENEPIVFRWSTGPADGSVVGVYQYAVTLQYSADRTSWTVFANVAGGETAQNKYTAAPETIPTGNLFWRIRSTNTDHVNGPWSAPVGFSHFGAPSISQVTADDKPFTTISWASSSQQAYRITIDGSVVYGPYWGTNVHSFTLPIPLADGAHTAAVEVQNEYGQWSQPAQTDFTVTNVPGQPVSLSGRMGRDAELRWTCEDATADFLVYRDGVQIGHSSGYSFTDRTVLDYHTWRVINRLPSGYYTASNTVSGTLCTEGLALALLAGGPWIDLTLSTNPIRTTTATGSRSVVLRQFAGREWPDAESAPYKTLQISFDVSFTAEQTAQARAFEALIGEPVIFKEPGEEAFVGVLSAFERSHSCPARSYTATVQRIHWRGVVDADS